jgi:hypothetical protein
VKATLAQRKVRRGPLLRWVKVQNSYRITNAFTGEVCARLTKKGMVQSLAGLCPRWLTPAGRVFLVETGHWTPNRRSTLAISARNRGLGYGETVGKCGCFVAGHGTSKAAPGESGSFLEALFEAQEEPR